MQQYVFTPISNKAIYDRLCYICQQEHFTNYEAVCDLISKAVNGSMRNAITYLDQCSTYSKQLDIEVVKQLINIFSYEAVFKLTWALCQNNSTEIISIIESIFTTSLDDQNKKIQNTEADKICAIIAIYSFTLTFSKLSELLFPPSPNKGTKP